MTNPKGPSGTGVTIQEILSSAGELELEALRQRFGDAFLIYTGRVGDMKPPDRPWKATVVGGGAVGQDGLVFLNKEMLVYPVRHSERSLTPLFISVGRVAGTNDVVINDSTVSGAHAVIERTPDGGYAIRDLGSRNGTFVENEPVPRRESRPVRSGDTVRFGSIILTFVDVQLFHVLIRAVTR